MTQELTDSIHYKKNHIFHIYTIQFPTVLSMEKEQQIASHCKLQSWIGEYDKSSPAELFTFVFEKKTYYEVFHTEMVDKMKYRIFARIE